MNIFELGWLIVFLGGGGVLGYRLAQVPGMLAGLVGGAVVGWLVTPALSGGLSHVARASVESRAGRWDAGTDKDKAAGPSAGRTCLNEPQAVAVPEGHRPASRVQ